MGRTNPVKALIRAARDLAHNCTAEFTTCSKKEIAEQPCWVQRCHQIDRIARWAPQAELEADAMGALHALAQRVLVLTYGRRKASRKWDGNDDLGDEIQSLIDTREWRTVLRLLDKHSPGWDK